MKKILILFMVIFMINGIKVNANNLIYSDTINSINGIRYENYIVYYDYLNNGSKSPANQWGYEVAFNKDGVVVETNTNVTIPKDGFILSGHGSKKEFLMNVKIGDKAVVDLNKKTFTITRDPLSANIFQANIRLEEARKAKESGYSFGYVFEEDEVNTKLQSLEEKIALLQTADINQSNNLLTEINRLADLVIYMTSQTKFIEVRAVWHRPFGTYENEASINGIIRLLTKFRDLGFNTIFLETFWNGYASYRSEILETHPRVGINFYGTEYGYDYVKAFIGEANKLGINVHAWIHTFSAGSLQYKSSIIKEEWLVENYQGSKLHPNDYGGSYYYDPSNPEVLEFLEGVIVEMMSKYNFAGLQYDYIRYYDNNYNITPIRDSGYGANPERVFKEQYNLTGDVRALIKNQEYRDKWNKWRQANINNAVRQFTKAIRKARNDVIISAAVVSDINIARNIYMQDWLTWVKEGHIDMLAPMIYTGSSDAVFNVSRDIMDKLKNLSYLVSGIAPIYYGYSTMNNHMQILSTNQALGNALFASQNVINLQDVEESLKYGRYRYQAVSISNSIQEVVEFSLNGLKTNINNTYKKRNLIDSEASSILINEIDQILSMDCKNPDDYKQILKRIQLLSNLTLYVKSENLRQTINTEINSLAQTIDIAISRYLINHDYWDPLDGKRPDPANFTYDNPVDVIDDNPSEISDSRIKIQLYISLSLLILVSFLFTIKYIYQRKVTR